MSEQTYPDRGSPNHPTYSNDETHCGQREATAAPHAYPREQYEICLRHRQWHREQSNRTASIAPERNEGG